MLRGQNVRLYVASDLVHAHDLYKNELQSSYTVHKWLMTAQSPVS